MKQGMVGWQWQLAYLVCPGREAVKQVLVCFVESSFTLFLYFFPVQRGTKARWLTAVSQKWWHLPATLNF